MPPISRKRSILGKDTHSLEQNVIFEALVSEVGPNTNTFIKEMADIIRKVLVSNRVGQGNTPTIKIANTEATLYSLGNWKRKQWGSIRA